MVAPIDATVAPLGGTQALLADLARGLAERGHAVTLLAADGSHVAGVHVPRLGIDPRQLVRARFGDAADTPRPDLAAQDAAFAAARAWVDRHAADLDVVHAHAYDAPAFDRLRGAPVPVVHTLHLPPLDPSVVAAVGRAAQDATLVCVSYASAEGWRQAGVRVDREIPNGLDLRAIPFGANHAGYLLWVGRVAPEKGPDVAIRAAGALNMPLLLVGNVYDEAYFVHAVRPLVHEQPERRLGEPLLHPATFVGHRPRYQVATLMAGAAATLLPVRWEEPFGLVAAEAQAAGSPVAAFARGALPQVVATGLTGCLAEPDDEPDFVRAVQAALRIDRAACRAWVAERFGLQRMLASYEALYASVSSAS